MFKKFMQLISLSCRHRRMSKPFAAASSGRAAVASDWDTVNSSTNTHYVVCLDCGHKFPYDWSKMKVVY